MGKTIFLAVPSHAKFKGRIRKFGRAAGGAPVEWLLVAPSLHFETLAPARNFLSLPEVLENLRAKEQKVI
jgi:hypothetical protein